jgi:tmRNA-binding protein
VGACGRSCMRSHVLGLLLGDLRELRRLQRSLSAREVTIISLELFVFTHKVTFLIAEDPVVLNPRDNGE